MPLNWNASGIGCIFSCEHFDQFRDCEISSDQNPAYLVYVGDYTITNCMEITMNQLHGNYDEPLIIRIQDPS